MNGFNTLDNLNTIPIEYYAMFIGMDWLQNHRVILKCYDKKFSCIDEECNTIVVKGIPRKTTIR